MYFFTSDLAEDVALNVEVSSVNKKSNSGPTDNVLGDFYERSPPGSSSARSSTENGSGGLGLSSFLKFNSSPGRQQPDFFEREEIIESVVVNVGSSGASSSTHTSTPSMVPPLMKMDMNHSDIDDASFPFHPHQPGMVSAIDLGAFNKHSANGRSSSEEETDEDDGGGGVGGGVGRGRGLGLPQRPAGPFIQQPKFAGRVSYKNKASAINFDKSWLANRSDWLMYNGSVAYCKPCRERFLPKVKGHHSRFVYGFYNGFSLDRILAHETSYFHEIAVRSWNKKHANERIQFVPRPRERSSNSGHNTTVGRPSSSPKKTKQLLNAGVGVAMGPISGMSSAESSAKKAKKPRKKRKRTKKQDEEDSSPVTVGKKKSKKPKIEKN